MTVIERLTRNLPEMVFAQAARLGEQIARRAGRKGEVGTDTPVADEPTHFIASDRMALTTHDLAEATFERDSLHLTANLMGLAGATPALPPAYSEMQLQRRRQRDGSLAAFFNLFDHRALSFFYRIFRKYNWTVAFEREPRPGSDPASRAVLALAGFGTAGLADRLAIDDAALVPLAPKLGDARRSASSVETVLQITTGLPLRVLAAEPTWLDLPPTEQSQLGRLGQFSTLGGIDLRSGMGEADAAILGSAVLDVQHHYAVEIGPIGHRALIDFCSDEGKRRILGEVCMLAAGMEHQPLVRLLIKSEDIPRLALGDPETPAMLGWTSWLASPEPPGAIVADCTIRIDRAAIGR